MKDTNERDAKREVKAPYEPPRLRIIELAAEEVLGTACKSQAGPGQTQAGHGCLSIECKQLLGS